MTFSHAVAQIHHHAAKVLQFDGDDFQLRKVTAHRDDTGQHGSDVRYEHEFFEEVCDSLDGTIWVLIAGGHAAQPDFHSYIDKHRPALLARVAGWETIEHPTEGQLLALARKYLVLHDRVPSPADHP